MNRSTILFLENTPKAPTPPVEDNNPNNSSTDHPSCQFRTG